MTDTLERGVLSHSDRKKPAVRRWFRALQIVILAALIVVGLGPLLWLSKAALSTSQAIIRNPLSLFPAGGVQWANLVHAWVGDQIGVFIGNSLVLAAGCVVSNLIVCVTVAYVLSVLRPKWGPALEIAILATLFIPAVVVLVPLYLTVLHLPLIGVNLQNTDWAIWLPAAANPFNVVVVKRFFDAIPRELFEAARVDGAGPWRVLVSIVIPLSRPILAVIALLAAIASWKDFLWPLVVLPDPALQPVSVALTKITITADVAAQMASLLLALILPVVLFLVFQRQFLRGVAMSGGVKE
jgi:multiple sugar transport system permease protein